MNKPSIKTQHHIGFFGKMSSGKSSLINAITGIGIGVASEVKQATLNPVSKEFEIIDVGPCVFIDTGGTDGSIEETNEQMKKAKEVVEIIDLAIFVSETNNFHHDDEIVSLIKKRRVPIINVLNKADKQANVLPEGGAIKVSARTGEGLDALLLKIRSLLKRKDERILGDLVHEGDTVVLLMPCEDKSNENNIILPQAQIIREIQERNCVAVCVTPDNIEKILSTMKPPRLLITDSSVFDLAQNLKPCGTLLTSFAILFAKYRGDMEYFVESTKAFKKLNKDSKILVAYHGSHSSVDMTITNEKIPKLIQEKYGKEITIEYCEGEDYPEDLSGYDLIIHCGGTILNRDYFLSQIEKAKIQNIPMTNYAIAIAYLKGILEYVVY